jgi:cell division protein FtsN
MTSSIRAQRGGTLLGFIFGLIVGVAVSLGLAVYVTKVPIPFMNKGLTHTPDQDASEDKKNKDWDPNAPLYNKSATKNSTAAATSPAEPASADKAPTPAVNAAPAPLTSKEQSPSNPLSAVFGTAPASGDASNAANPASAAGDKADPMGDLARSKANGIDAFLFYVQAGAFRTHDEADTQKGKLALAGFDTTLSERDQGGKTVYRVRVGPLNTKDEADKIQQKLSALKVDSVVVRVQK